MNEVLATLETAAVFRDLEVVLAALLGRRPLERREDIKGKPKHKLSEGYVLSEEELTDLRDGFALTGTVFNPEMKVLIFHHGGEYVTDYLFVNDAYPKLEAGSIKAGGSEKVVRYMRFLDVMKSK